MMMMVMIRKAIEISTKGWKNPGWLFFYAASVYLEMLEGANLGGGPMI
jgi:hypothetical protein